VRPRITNVQVTGAVARNILEQTATGAFAASRVPSQPVVTTAQTEGPLQSGHSARWSPRGVIDRLT